ncbi:unnamed protein product, partial [Dovyalis caffra]
MAPSRQYKRQQLVPKCEETSRDLPCICSTTSTSSKESCSIKNDQEGEMGIGCSTPKAQRFKIPEILSCPPAPMKKREYTWTLTVAVIEIRACRVTGPSFTHLPGYPTPRQRNGAVQLSGTAMSEMIQVLGDAIIDTMGLLTI